MQSWRCSVRGRRLAKTMQSRQSDHQNHFLSIMLVTVSALVACIFLVVAGHRGSANGACVLRPQ